MLSIPLGRALDLANAVTTIRTTRFNGLEHANMLLFAKNAAVSRRLELPARSIKRAEVLA